MTVNVIDNFLPKDEFDKLKNIVMFEIPWYFQQSINSAHNIKNDYTFYMTHSLWNFQFNGIYSTYYKDFKIIIDKLMVKTLVRMKLNLYPKTDKLQLHEPHTDYNYNHKGCLFSFNTCDGGTVFYKNKKQIKIDSVENRALLFDPSKLHSSTSCTNAKARFNLNINYF